MNPKEQLLSILASWLGGRDNIRLRLRQKLAPAIRLVYGTFTADDLFAHLKKRLPDDYDILFVHSSVNALMPMYCGNELELLRGLIDFVGEERTLAMPAFFFGQTTTDMVSWYREHPTFDAKRTPSRMGLINELFRRTPGTLRSLHPAHSVAAKGPLAEELTSTHHLADTVLGKNTPFEKLTRHRTLFLGIGPLFQYSLTHTHYVEDLLGEEYPATYVETDVPVTLIDLEGKEIPFQYKKKHFHGEKVLERLPGMMQPGVMHEWRFHGAPLYWAWEKGVTESMVAAAKKGWTMYRQEGEKRL